MKKRTLKIKKKKINKNKRYMQFYFKFAMAVN